MKSYEGSFFEHDPDTIVPDHYQTSEIMPGNEHFSGVLRVLAEYHTGRHAPENSFTKQEELALIADMKAGRAQGADTDTQAVGLEARQKLIEVNALAVHDSAETLMSAYVVNSMSTADKVQAAMVGLVRAVDELGNCQVDKYISVSDYAGRLIKWERYNAAKADAAYPAYDDLKFPYAASEENPSLDFEDQQPLGFDEVAADYQSATVEEAVCKTSLSLIMEEIFKDMITSTLPQKKASVEREVEILRYRYGFITGQKENYVQAGRVFGISSERVRTIETRALNRLRNPKYQEALRAYND